MPSKPRTRRIQAAHKKNIPVAEIAAKEGVSEKTVVRAITSKQFQKSLIYKLGTMGQRRVDNSGNLDEIIALKTDELLKKMKDPDPKVRDSVKLTCKDLADLGKLSHLQYEQGVDYLREAIRRGQEQVDEQLKKDSAILDETEAVPA